MAELAENILKEILETASARKTDASIHHEELITSIQSSTLSVDDIGTKVKDAAEAEAAAIVLEDKTTAAKAAADKEDAITNRGVLEKIHGSLSSGFGQLGSSIKSDFSMLTAPLQLMAQAPGMKTIITLLKIVGMWLAKLFLHLITKKLFSGLREVDASGSLDVMKTLGSFKKWGLSKVGIGSKISRLTGDVVTKSGVGGKGKKSQARDPKTGRFVAEEETFKGSVGAAYNQMSESWVNMKGAMAKKFESMKNKATDMLSAAGNATKTWAGNILKSAWKLVKDTKVYKFFAAAGKAVAGTFMKMTKALWGYVKKMIIPIAAFIIAGIMMVAMMIASAFAMILPAIPIILIIAAIVLLVMGLVWLGKKIVENWDRIKESFSMAMEQLSIWGAKGVAFIGNIFKSIWLAIKGFFITVLQGIENGINAAIGKINEVIPGTSWDLDPVDLGASGMRAGLDEETIKFEQTKKEQGAQIAAREAALADRRVAYDAAGMEQPSGDTNQQNIVVNQSTTRKHISTTTDPTDMFAGNAALAQ